MTSAGNENDLTYYRLFDLLSEQERQALMTLRFDLEKMDAGWNSPEISQLSPTNTK